MRTILAVAAVAFLAFANMAVAQDKPSSPFADPACPKLAEVEAVLTKRGEKFVVLDIVSLLNVAPKSPLHILVSTFDTPSGNFVVYGYETPDGCVNGPTPIGEVASKVGA